MVIILVLLSKMRLDIRILQGMSAVKKSILSPMKVMVIKRIDPARFAIECNNCSPFLLHSIIAKKYV